MASLLASKDPSTLNLNPVVHAVSTVTREEAAATKASFDSSAAVITNDEDAVDEIDNLEVFELLRHINDPEHPLTLEQLHVVQLGNIWVDNQRHTVRLTFTPTIPHCSMATLIGLCIRVKLLRSLPTRFKVEVRVTPGSHTSEVPISKQLNDKERVAAALENSHLLEVVNKCIAHTDGTRDAPVATATEIAAARTAPRSAAPAMM